MTLLHDGLADGQGRGDLGGRHLLHVAEDQDLGVRRSLERRANPCEPIRGKLPVDWLLEEYHRTDQLGACLRLLFARGAVLRDPVVAPVLLNDADAINADIKATPSLLQHRTTLVSAFTSLVGVSLLHVAAEYGKFEAAVPLSLR